MAILRWIDDWLAFLEDGLLGLGTAVLAIFLFVNVLLRYVFSSPVAWMEEGIVALFVWLIFIGVSASFRTHQHLRIDVMVRFLPRNAAMIMGSLAVASTAVILGLLLTLGLDYARFVAGNRTPILGISAAWVYVGLPLGMAFSMVHLLRQVLDEGPADVLRSVIEDEPQAAAPPAGGGP